MRAGSIRNSVVSSSRELLVVDEEHSRTAEQTPSQPSLGPWRQPRVVGDEVVHRAHDRVAAPEQRQIERVGEAVHEHDVDDIEATSP